MGPQEVTHELLLVAHRVVKSVAAAPPRLTGKAQKRLLAWVVADSMSSAPPLDRQLAETVGKRLEKQAEKIASQLEAAVTDAEQVRQDARGVAALAGLSAAEAIDPGDRTDDALASIDTEERECCRKLRLEVYLGFWELGLSSSWARHQLMGPPPPAIPSEPSTLPDAPLGQDSSAHKDVTRL